MPCDTFLEALSFYHSDFLSFVLLLSLEPLALLVLLVLLSPVVLLALLFVPLEVLFIQIFFVKLIVRCIFCRSVPVWRRRCDLMRCMLC